MSVIHQFPARINGKLYQLTVEEKTLDGWKAYHILHNDTSKLFQDFIPNDLTLVEKDTGIQFEPAISSPEGRAIAQDIYIALKTLQSGHQSNIQPDGPALG
ncbi:hypothetical protein MKQ68_05990 [Chitinophaga horti]|uniref:Uncharacterized protein n=1 Tax=Chitinophaga horti TaxID=2920382 RepID=A0ABY6J4N8_9BACT|nr:hypothetical protein [Chitinophaga horti]UYQ94641.1 hypothetical protein MKQ68_05990 [Chitinophaga horti]